MNLLSTIEKKIADHTEMDAEATLDVVCSAIKDMLAKGEDVYLPITGNIEIFCPGSVVVLRKSSSGSSNKEKGIIKPKKKRIKGGGGARILDIGPPAAPPKRMK